MKASLSLNGYMLIDDKKATAEQINAIIAERDNALTQNAELVDHVEALSGALKSAVRLMRTTGKCSGWHEKANEAESLTNQKVTPAQHLRDRDAEVVSKTLKGLLHTVANQYGGEDKTEWSIGANHVFRLFAKEITKRQEGES